MIIGNTIGGAQALEVWGAPMVLESDFSIPLSDWMEGDSGSGISVEDAKLKIINNDASAAMASYELQIETGETYLFSYESYQGSSLNNNSSFGLGSNINNVTKFYLSFSTDGEHSHIYTANFTGTAYITIKNGTVTSGEYMLFDNVIVKKKITAYI